MALRVVGLLVPVTSLCPARPASHRRRGVLRHLVDHHARHREPELPDRLVGVPLPRVVETDPQPGRYERRRQVSAKGLLFDLLRFQAPEGTVRWVLVSIQACIAGAIAWSCLWLSDVPAAC